MSHAVSIKLILNCLSRVSTGMLICATLLSPAFAQNKTMIVLDGSGSMWGRIDGKPKLEIAREVLRDVLPRVPQSTELGLIAYGHREKGNCADIEMIVPPAQATAGQITDKVDKLKFLGKTPLSAAVQFAAENMRYTEDRATVVLITDGIETCGRNVCEVGSLLEEQGIDFTAHVVGFGLSKEEGSQVACLAENTGGQYFSANNGDSLVAALNEIVVVTPAQFTFVAVNQKETPVENIMLDWIIKDLAGTQILAVNGKTNAVATLAPGDYTVFVSGVDVSGGTEFTITENAEDRVVHVPVEITVLSATIEAPESVAAGAEFGVVWTGPGGKNDYITIVEAGVPEKNYGDYAYTRNGSPAKLKAPDGLGAYEIRYFHKQSKRVLASQKINLTAVEASLKAPMEVSAGAEFKVVWTGPDNKGDYITIVEAGAPEKNYGDYAYTRNGSPAKLKAPDGLGAYEIRYIFGQSKRILATGEITLGAVEASLEGPAEVRAGASFSVNWTGPANKGDYITIVEAGTPEGKHGNYAYTRNGSPAKIAAPDGLGAYEIRYIIAQSKRVLAAQPIKLTAIAASLAVENTPVPGGDLIVNWTGPDNKGDYITIVEVGTPQGKYGNYAPTGRGSPLKLKAPKALGKFELRYIIASSKRTLATLPITLAVAKVSISVAPSVASGGVVEVTWTGPANQEDFIEIVPLGAAANAKPLGHARTAQGSPLSIFAPASAGDYIVRYKMRDSGKVLASAPLKVE